jgi:hypothetical protein
VTPPTGAAGVCPNSVVTATFSEAMNAATIIGPATTFTLTGPGTTPVVWLPTMRQAMPRPSHHPALSH